MSDSTVTYRPETLGVLVKKYEKVIAPADKLLQEEWEKWDEESAKEMKEIVDDIDIELLRATFERVYKKYGEDSITTEMSEVNRSFLWFNWVEKREKPVRVPKLESLELSNKIFEEFEAVTSKLSNVKLNIQCYPCSDRREESFHNNHITYQRFKHDKCILLREGITDYSLSVVKLPVYLDIRGSVLSPQEPKYKYSVVKRNLAELKELTKLPDTDLITLGPQQAEEFAKVVKMVEKIASKSAEKVSGDE
jgi:hypothetical protein